jgi:hypothetical protein
MNTKAELWAQEDAKGAKITSNAEHRTSNAEYAQQQNRERGRGGLGKPREGGDWLIRVNPGESGRKIQKFKPRKRMRKSKRKIEPGCQVVHGFG